MTRRPGPLAEAASLALFLGSWAVSLWIWFTDPGRPGWGFALAFGLALVSTTAVLKSGAPALARPHRNTALVCGLATIIRLPALIWPLGFVGADGSLQAFLTHSLLSGARPAPIFLDGSSYEGSLKAHIAAALGGLSGQDDLARLLVGASLLLWWIFIASTMALARRIGGEKAAIFAGMFAALSPRFAMIFSVSNAGPYPDALGLGTLALAWVARIVASGAAHVRPQEFLLVGTILGVAFWQQPIVVSFAIVATGAIALDAFWRRRLLASLVPLGLGLLLGRLPATLHDLRLGGAASEVVSGFARGAGGGLPFGDQIEGTLTWAFPVVFLGLRGDTTLPVAARGAMGILAASLFVAFAAPRLGQAALGWRARRIEPAILPIAHFALALALVWLAAGEGQYSRPRYFLTLFPAYAIAFGCVFASLIARRRGLASATAGAVLLWNAGSNIPRFSEGIDSHEALRAFVAWIENEGLRAGYSDFSVSGPITMASNERVVVAGLLGPMSGEHVSRHVEFVARHGADFFVTRPDEARLLARRLERLGVTFQIARENLPILYKLSRPVALHEVGGFRENP